MERLNFATIDAAANHHDTPAPRPTLTVVPALQKTEWMPFTIRIVRDDAGFQKAVSIRRAAYSRHLPEFAEKMEVEAADHDYGTVVLLAESKLDGTPLGTMRIQTNARKPLAVEQSVTLPPHLATSRLAEATRLGVAGGMVGRVVKVALCKALWMFCEQHEIDYVVITARAARSRVQSDAVQGRGSGPPALGRSAAPIVQLHGHGAHASSGHRSGICRFIF